MGKRVTELVRSAARTKPRPTEARWCTARTMSAWWTALTGITRVPRYHRRSGRGLSVKKDRENK